MKKYLYTIKHYYTNDQEKIDIKYCTEVYMKYFIEMLNHDKDLDIHYVGSIVLKESKSILEIK